MPMATTTESLPKIWVGFERSTGCAACVETGSHKYFGTSTNSYKCMVALLEAFTLFCTLHLTSAFVSTPKSVLLHLLCEKRKGLIGLMQFEKAVMS